MARVITKADGTDTLVVRFAYDAALVDTFKASIPWERYGRTWNGQAKAWLIAPRVDTLVPLARFAAENDFVIAPEAAAVISRVVSAAADKPVTSNAALSRAVAPLEEPSFDLTGLGGTLRPFQIAGVEFIVRNRRVLVGDEMGLGKTVEALAAAHVANAFPLLVICPASLKINWSRESMKWLPERSVVILNGKVPNATEQTADVTVINYDVLEKHLPLLQARGFKGLVVDEAHYCKNHQAKRTKAVEALAKPIAFKVLLTGTPILNRPVELVAPLAILDRLYQMGGFWQFVHKYCNATQTRFGWDMTGASNTLELNDRLRAVCYLRREKVDVAKELPPKVRVTVPLAIDNRAEYNRVANADAGSGETAVHDEQGNSFSNGADALVKISALRQLAVAGKMAAALEWIQSFLESGEKLVVFGWHQSTIAAVAAAVDGSVLAGVITGATPLAERQRAVDAFQNDPVARIIVCNMQAGGVGLTLTAASNVAFLEYGWNPGTQDQAEDRCHRIGQNRETVSRVTAWYLAAEGTIDEDICALVEDKRVVTTAVTIGSGQVFTDADGEEISANDIATLLAGVAKRTRSASEIAEHAAQAGAERSVRIVESGPVTPVVRDGYYTVVLTDGSHVTIRLSTWKSKSDGTQVASYLFGPSNASDYRMFAVVRGGGYQITRANERARVALDTLLSADKDGQRVAGEAYAMVSNNCWVCGRMLTTPESIAAHIGPVCAGKL